MLKIYPFILETIAALRPLSAEVTRKDADLGRQLRRASASSRLEMATTSPAPLDCLRGWSILDR